MKTRNVVLSLYILSAVAAVNLVQPKAYTADWKSLDSRPLPAWYDQDKIGIFVHWGIFSVPAHSCKNGAEWYWFNWKNNLEGCDAAWHNATYGPDFEYAKFGPMFKAQLFDPAKWAKLFKKSGARYVVFTSKHHEGWTNFPSPQAWNWNSVDNGPGKDLTRLLTDAVRKEGLKMGLYHSLFEWYHPLYLADKANNYNTTRYVDEVLTPQLYQIVNDYAPSVVWSDGDWEANDTYWKAKEFLAWLYNSSPSKYDVVVNDRWGQGDWNTHGGFYTGADRYNPDGIQIHKWESCFTIDSGSWGYNRNSTLEDYLTIETLISLVVQGVAKNGNVLINVGPTADGLILPIYEERLTQLGSWLDVNGESIYGSRPWRISTDNNTDYETWYTTNSGDVYVSFMPWPTNGMLQLVEPIAGETVSAVLLGYNGGKLYVTSQAGASGVVIALPQNPLVSVKSKWMYTIRLNGVV